MVVYGDTLYGRSTMDYMREYMKEKGYTVVGAVNAAFFDLKNGLPLGMVVTDGILRASGSGVTLGVEDDGGILLGDALWFQRLRLNTSGRCMAVTGLPCA